MRQHPIPAAAIRAITMVDSDISMAPTEMGSTKRRGAVCPAREAQRRGCSQSHPTGLFHLALAAAEGSLTDSTKRGTPRVRMTPAEAIGNLRAGVDCGSGVGLPSGRASLTQSINVVGRCNP